MGGVRTGVWGWVGGPDRGGGVGAGGCPVPPPALMGPPTRSRLRRAPGGGGGGGAAALTGGGADTGGGCELCPAHDRVPFRSSPFPSLPVSLPVSLSR